mmetsp:Transcript_95750/g.187978  ORF Transcript_95750/g.187978 Transcript_95750/m.187978 type:complete len:293 (-) Transcript_95750:831-1709(-)
MSASITNKAGVTKIYTPGVVDDVSVAFKCDKCMEVLFSNSNLQRHRVNSCKGLQPVNKVGALKVGRSENKGSSARRSYTHREKMAAVLHYNTFPSGTSGNAVAKMYCTTTGLPECTVSDWLRTPTSRAKIVRDWMHDPSSKRGGQCARGKVAKGQFHAAEEILFKEILKRRERGRRVSPRFVSRTMKILVNTIYEKDADIDELLWKKAESFVPSPSWRCRFYGRYQLTIRRRTNKKSLPLAERIEKWKKFHAGLRLFIRSNLTDPKYGRFHPRDRYNVDQVFVRKGLSHLLL